MKQVVALLGIITLSGALSIGLAQDVDHDDLYFNSSDREKINASFNQKKKKTFKEEPNEEVSKLRTSSDEDSDDQSNYDFNNSRYTRSEDDFYYSRQLRSFSRPYYAGGFNNSYYDPFYDPFYGPSYGSSSYYSPNSGISISVSSGFGYSPYNSFGNSYYNPYCTPNYGFNPYTGYNSFYSNN